MSKTSSMRLMVYESYMSMIQGAIGTQIFQHLWFRVAGKPKEIVRGGEVSCALFVSSILKQFDLGKTAHATVNGTIADMKQSGWKKIKKVRPGAVIRWAPVQYPDRLEHEHIGFALSATKAISNSTSKKVPHQHTLTYGKKSDPSYRPVLEMWWHPKLGK